jgi:hypothetical protein
MELSCDIAIVDEGANLIAFHRMDNARIADIEVSKGKAWTSPQDIEVANAAVQALASIREAGAATIVYARIGSIDSFR